MIDASDPPPSDAATAGTAEQPAGAVAAAEFLLRLRTRGIRDLSVLRALETVPRQTFVPHRYADLATRDVALPIGCGQTMPDPFFLAQMIEALELQPSHRVLEIGTGSGYVTAVLARLVREVLSIERFQSLVTEAKARLAGLGVGNAAIVWGDGLTRPEGAGRFDRIVVEALIDQLPAAWVGALAPDGAIVAAKAAFASGALHRRGQHLVRISRGPAGRWVETAITASRLRPLIPGSSLGL